MRIKWTLGQNQVGEDLGSEGWSQLDGLIPPIVTNRYLAYRGCNRTRPASVDSDIDMHTGRVFYPDKSEFENQLRLELVVLDGAAARLRAVPLWVANDACPPRHVIAARVRVTMRPQHCT